MTPRTDANPRTLLIFVPKKFASGDRYPKNTACATWAREKSGLKH
ncbi:hypothetical protein [Oscillatoria sp. HE19RPO]|nr:hypothetical protein [Oscillatoria sp. HE19RPO]